MEFKPPKTPHEANLTAEVYRRLKNVGVEVYISYRIKGSEFDLVVFRDGHIKAIYEMKTSRDHYRKKGSQFRRYLGNLAPLFIVVGFEGITEAVDCGVKAWHGENMEMFKLIHGENWL